MASAYSGPAAIIEWRIYVMARLKVLISAYACEPCQGSEPSVGWNTAVAAAADHDVWVLTRESNRKSIEAEMRYGANPSLCFVYYDLPRWMRWWKAGQRGVQVYYYVWQVGAYFAARVLHRRVSFDLVHHVTFVKYWMPSFLAMLPVPFIWGPVGGGDSAPREFRRTFSLRGRTYEHLRDLARWLGERDPFVRSTARRSALILAATEETGARLARLARTKPIVLSQCVLTREEFARLSRLPKHSGSPVRFISVGRLLHLKAFNLALRAFARSGISDSEYWIVGDGPEHDRLQDLATKLGIADQVVFLGRLSHEETLERIGQCDVVVQPGLHESGGWVCLEAMAASRVPVCAALGGPATVVTPGAGFLIRADTPDQFVNEMSLAILRLAGEDGLRRQMGEAGSQRVLHTYVTDSRRRVVGEFYAAVVNEARVSDSGC